MFDYSYLLNTKSSDKWRKIGVNRRAGIVIPLFSVFSRKSAGIGEILDLKIVIDLCNESGISILQLLPMNDTGNLFAPYSAISSFALDPMYLRLENITGFDNKLFKQKINHLRKSFSLKGNRVNYKIKHAKLKLLFEMYSTYVKPESERFLNFVKQNQYWLKDYALFRLISDKYGTKWQEWEDNLKNRSIKAIEKIYREEFSKIQFEYWIQWQLYEQMKSIKEYASAKGVYILGDLPFLVSGESADVWSQQKYFKLSLSAGAPPDMFFTEGQNWHLPPYNWDTIARDDFFYIRQKLKYAENFYDMYRIDHFIGLFRIWTLDSKENISDKGTFDPESESVWEIQGKTILDVMLSSSSMLPCAEDLGTVPECSYKTLNEYGLPGIDFQRYMKNNFRFKDISELRYNSVSVLSTHDSSFFCNWWKFEAGKADQKIFQTLCRKYFITGNRYKNVLKTLFNLKNSSAGRLKWWDNIDSIGKLRWVLGLNEDEMNEFTFLYLDTFGEKNQFANFLRNAKHAPVKCSPSFIKEVLSKVSSSSSVFSIQVIHDYLAADKIALSRINKLHNRINIPGTVGKRNWSVLLPFSLDTITYSEKFKKLREFLKQMHSETGRI